METVANKFFNAHISHRQETHYFTHWLIAFIAFIFVWNFHGIGTAFAWGGLTHLITDSLTVSSIPFSPWSDRRFHLFGGVGLPLAQWVSIWLVAWWCWFVSPLSVRFKHPQSLPYSFANRVNTTRADLLMLPNGKRAVLNFYKLL